MTTRIYFVRHALPVQEHADDRTRPLTDEGQTDSALVQDFLSDKNIGVFYCSPYRRSLDTIRSAANQYHQEIKTDERLHERKSGPGGNNYEMFRKRWSDHSFHEEGGESISMVQERNIAALTDILKTNAGKNIVIGTHGTALSSVLNYYDPSFSCDDFMRIIDWMPYIIELDFDGTTLVCKREHIHIEKKHN
ncbi:MAG: histidine phosphatase family protein [Treponema sp.]|nr:histidine phosphatase family protein [Treponema sp.]